MSAPLWTAADLAEATGGQLVGAAFAGVDGISIDSRGLTPGDLFVALADRRDGHDFVADALARGAAAAMVSRIPENLAPDAPLLLVADSFEGLRALARRARARTTARVVAVTGSVGKTSVKEMLAHALTAQGRVHAAEASHNNHWGVPLTLARMPAKAAYAIVEIGMNAPGEIAPLAALAAPDVAIVTAIAPAHLEALGSIEAIAREKAAIFSGLKPGGIAILPTDTATADLLREGAERAGARIVGFGADAAAAWRLGDIRVCEDCLTVRLSMPGGPLLFKLGTPARHFAAGAAAVLAAIDAVGGDAVRAALDLASWAPPAGRGSRWTVTLDPVEEITFDLIDDAFNANPASMSAAFEVLAASRPRDGSGRNRHGRRIAILGDMLELGPTENDLHAALAADPSLARADVVHCVGRRMQALHRALPGSRRGEWFADVDALLPRLHLLIGAGDVVLVKGSKGSHVARAVDAALKLGQAVPRNNRDAS